jgi:GAF domain-containing protein
LLSRPRFEAAEDNLRQLIAELLVGTCDRKQFRQRVAELMRHFMNCSSVAIWAIDQPQIDGFRLVAHAGAGPIPSDREHALASSEMPELASILLREGVATWPDLDTDRSNEALQARLFAPASARALLVVSVPLNARNVGLMCACEAAGPRSWSRTEQIQVKRLLTRVVMDIGRLRPDEEIQLEPR